MAANKLPVWWARMPVASAAGQPEGSAAKYQARQSNQYALGEYLRGVPVTRHLRSLGQIIQQTRQPQQLPSLSASGVNFSACLSVFSYRTTILILSKILKFISRSWLSY